MMDNPNSQSEENNEQSFADILKEFESSKRPASGSAKQSRSGKGKSKGRPPARPPLRGTVVGISEEDVLVDFGGKSEGVSAAADLRDAQGNLNVKLVEVFDVAI